ncbi:OmpA family protein [Leptospira sp. 201903075]|nr:OmpA family protein [Leptospira chreensis]
MLVGLGSILYWIWRGSGQSNKPIPNVRKKNKSDGEENMLVMESETKEFSILFSAGSSSLEKQSVDLIREQLDQTILTQIGYIQLIGSADASGNVSKNRRLIKERVRIVERYLISLGIPKDKINTTFLDPSFGGSPVLRRLLRSVKIQYRLET